MEVLEEITKSGYAEMLLKDGIPFTESQFYLHSGVPSRTQGWILHISSTHIQLPEMLKRILPILHKQGVAFKLAKNEEILREINSGNLGALLVGKAISIYPDDDDLGVKLAISILDMTREMSGPNILTDYAISYALFVRYGSFMDQTMLDSQGNVSKFIKNSKGELIKDEYSIPAKPMPGVINPYTPLINEFKNKLKNKRITTDYLLVKALKSDLKGDVIKALTLKKLTLKWCVVKQGRRNMVTDSEGRDMIERLKWQRDVHNIFKDRIPIPNIIDYIEDNKDAYLIMQYIRNGKDIGKIAFEILNGQPWGKIDISSRLRLLGFLEQILHSLTIIHHNGFIHRDITNTNFIVSKEKVYLLDLELMYSSNQHYPDPPFEKGTLGFMSPQQEASLLPTVQDDIYSIGVLILSILVPIWPAFLIEADKDNMRAKLSFFIGNDRVERLIIRCLNVDPSLRPTMSAIQDCIRIYKAEIVDRRSMQMPIKKKHSVDEISEAITNGFWAIGNKMTTLDHVWLARNAANSDMLANRLGNTQVYANLYNGVSGVAYLLTKARHLEFETFVERNIEVSNWKRFIIEHINSDNQKDASLYYGTAGIGTLMACAEKYDDKLFDYNNDSLIRTCFISLCSEVNIIHGMSGQGISAINVLRYFKDNYILSFLQHIVGAILSSQEKDGSWKLLNNYNGKIVAEKKTSFGYGIAGVAYFLLEYGRQFNDFRSIKAACYALDYLTKISISKDGHLNWYNSDLDHTLGAWWCVGAPGISLAFMKAFEITGEQKYGDVAKRALRLHDREFLHHNLSQCHGLSGLGEVYLEAFKIFKAEEWRERASWIVSLIMTLKRTISSNSVYWFVEEPDFATAEFMVGNSGILHFLLRTLFPDQINFPLLTL